MTAEQARMARALLQLGVREIAAAAGVTPNTVSRVENGGDAKQSTIEALRKVYEARGVAFTRPGEPAIAPTVYMIPEGFPR